LQNLNNKMSKKESINLASLIVGIFLIIIGLISSAVTLPTKSSMIIFPVVSLLVGAFLALMGGLRKW